ncbi:MAG TPA: metallophosphoesterase [Candidatus Hydrogenedentes bacterium]|nr:metallophosphoesterase [Candidatus Hydrogenedentota bacterium]
MGCNRSYRARLGLIVAIVAVVCLLPVRMAFARAEDGTLAWIWSPHDGQPALTQPGQSFEVLLRGTSAPTEIPVFTLEGTDGAEFPLETKIHGMEQSAFARYTCVVPATARPGGYALRVRGTDGTTDITRRAVWVLDAEPRAYYVLAHVTDVHIGKQRPAGPDPDTTFSAVIEAISKTDAALCAITGDITESAEPDQFRRFLELLDRFTIPTLVCSGNHDRDNLWYERFWGVQTWARQFGPDGFLVFDTKDYVVADDWGPQAGRLHQLRRFLRPCRYTIGLTHRYEPAMGMRSQLILFVDDPIDLLLYGHTHQERRPGEGPSWGNAGIVITPACVDGYFRLIDITAQGPVARPVSRIPEDALITRHSDEKK